MKQKLQWGGRFAAAPDEALLAFGSSLEDDLVLAPFDVRVSHAHVAALAGGGTIDATRAAALAAALDRVGAEIAVGTFPAYARALAVEDVHGAIDARVREIEPTHGEWLHAGRSRNDQVATTLLLYAADAARQGAAQAAAIARLLLERAQAELAAETLLAATTHGQPAQPVLLAFWLVAAASPFARAAGRFAAAGRDAMVACPLGSGAVSGSSLPLDRAAAAAQLGFAAPSLSALDAIGTRDGALDVAHAYVRAAVDASRLAAELIAWAAPAYGYVRLGDASSTGSSLMPQKRNPDIFELTRAQASALTAAYAGALGTLTGLPLSYYRDLQETKRLVLDIIRRGGAGLAAFARALADTSFDHAACTARAADGFTVATDMAEALIRDGMAPRDAHRVVGEAVRRAEAEGAALPLSAAASVRAKATAGSTAPAQVRAAIAALTAALDGETTA